MQNWENLFRSHILNRGWDYYMEGAVHSLERGPCGYTAMVEGTEDYAVEIITEDGRVIEMYCDCPYADEGNNCKHMAAVLYEIEEKKLSAKPVLQEKLQENDLERIIKDTPEEELRKFVLQLAKEDPNLESRMIIRFGEKITKKQLAKLKCEVQEISDKYSDRSGYIDYYHASAYENDILNFLYEKVQPLIDKGANMDAFALVNEVYENVGDQDIDDSDGEIVEITSVCYELWEQILGKCDEDEEKQVYEWFKKYEKTHGNTYMLDEIERFMLEEFHDTEILLDRLAYLDKMIEQEINSETSDYYKKYRLEECILGRIRLMEELGYSEDEITEYSKKYRKFSEIRKLEVQKFLQKKEYEHAIKVLEESIQLDKDYLGLVAIYHKQLIDIYYQMGDKITYKTKLKEYILHNFQHSLEYVYRYKNVCDADEWIVQREIILQSSTAEGIKYQLMEEEGIHERLLASVLAEGSIFTLDAYETVLKRQDAEKVRDAYVSYVKSRAETVSNRKQYYSLILYLKKIRKYPDGERIAKEIVATWKVQYKRRPAMMDELKRAGF